MLLLPCTCGTKLVLLHAYSLAEKASKGSAGTGHKLGGDATAAPSSQDDMRAKMAAAAEARLKAMGA